MTFINQSLTDHQSSSAAQIGPNALIQTVRAVDELTGAAQLRTVLDRCGQADLHHAELDHMVDERLFADLVRAVTATLGAEKAQEILYQSGQWTADYLLTHRIPWLFQVLLRMLPRDWALLALLAAIRNHAWTFTGSGQFRYTVRRPVTLTVACTIEPGHVTSAFYHGTFSHLLQTLIDHRTRLALSTAAEGERTICTYAVRYEA